MQTASTLPDLVCACATVRRAARLVTQLYSEEMGGTIEPAQFSLLTTLSRRPGVQQGELGKALGLDKTTLSRNLKVMQKNGWIEPAPGEDRRARGYRVTESGVQVLAATKPGWARAQARLKGALQGVDWQGLMDSLNGLSEAALDERKP